MPPGKIYLSNHGSEVVTEALFAMVWSKKRPCGFNLRWAVSINVRITAVRKRIDHTDGAVEILPNWRDWLTSRAQ